MGDAATDYRVGQSGAVVERQRPDGFDVVGNDDAFQAAAVIKGAVSDAEDAAGNRISSGDSPWKLNQIGFKQVKKNIVCTAVGGV